MLAARYPLGGRVERTGRWVDTVALEKLCGVGIAEGTHRIRSKSGLYSLKPKDQLMNSAHAEIFGVHDVAQIKDFPT